MSRTTHTLCMCTCAAFAGHTVLSNLFPWIQHKYDNLIAAQLSGVSEADRKAAQGVAVPIAVKLLKDRCEGERESHQAGGLKCLVSCTVTVATLTQLRRFAKNGVTHA